MWQMFGAALVAAICAILLSACGYDGSYRYPCQNPDNWALDECKPPLCIPSGTCTRDLIYSRQNA